MKILHVTPSVARSYGGPTQSLGGYISASRLSGDEIHVATPPGSDAELEFLKQAGAEEVFTFKSAGSGSSAMSPSLVRWVRSNSRFYDVVHVHGLFNFISAFGSRAAIRSGAAVVIRPFGTLSRYTFTHRRSTLKRAWFDKIESPNLIDAAALHFTTTSERDEAEWHELDLSAKAHVVPPPFIDDSAANRAQRRDAERETVLFLGRMHPVKNLEPLVRAWPGVLAERPSAHLVIAGSGDERYLGRIKGLVSQLRIGNSVSFPGFLTGAAKAEAFAAASLFVLPSLHENFGIVVLEAIAAGLPVILSRHVQLSDFAAGQHLGVIADDDPASLTRSILEVLADRKLHEHVAAAGQSLVRENYGPRPVGIALSSMYLAATLNRPGRKS